MDPFRFQAHPDVWVLVAFLVGVVRLHGAGGSGRTPWPPGQPVVTRRNVWCFAAAMALLWAASDWPIHDIGERYLYSAHMLQHMMLTLLPAAAGAAGDAGVAAAGARRRRAAAYRGAARGCASRSSPASLFNLAVIVSHIPGVVNTSVDVAEPASRTTSST